jgi:hypothetical protein
MAKKAEGSVREDLQAQTARRAYAIWESMGRPHGYDRQHWLQAEAELSAAKGPAQRTGAASKGASATRKTARTATVAAQGAAAMTAAAGTTPTEGTARKAPRKK